MGSFSIWHWLVVLLIVILVFGTKKLRNIGHDLGSAIRGFKEGMKSGEAEAEEKGGTVVAKTEAQPSATASSAHPSSTANAAGSSAAEKDATVIEGQIREKSSS
ncbi:MULTISPECIES: Sec-independent protein translocase subunit TatA [Pseudomonadota]|jgi:sec-independent protein translocase protein TatA|uniref:Sec-independent protein translocase protein TatA n=1 Tax=Hydrogenophilus thermoluteolus TaxID=297 RepID=A0A2Z6DYK8_HYDTE|nr:MULTISPECIES: Sec-independent protein translocase subunit TatA [Pseudomonadota]HCO78162.1 Sec-independent protein translocase subunit TatA [Rhodocyclaceae bacterium]MBW7655682.1 Sec-independent protein translocase subunit TatA [Hydrogenophilus thermoluteolus]BBD77345.1 twin-arginine translocase subunit TatA [Hydrogenophilus thermoluteolus]GLW61158.1 hypothetical protein Hthe01_15070 [Hydrogenophilus thermoluteolus]HNQ49119.1 Sec-independent protein translocase subunit TatA [Hydrogenophilus 